MKNILVVGAGRSSTSLIRYLLASSETKGWLITVADAKPSLAEEKVAGHKNGLSVWLDVNKPNDRKDLIKRADVVISLLPAELHFKIARDCVSLRKHLLTASYVDAQFQALDEDAASRGLVFIAEMGLDPGIDHMSASRRIDEIRGSGGELTHFRSYTGGLVSPESDDNPWHYKITWNPSNIILAGQGTAKYLNDGRPKYIPYHRLFQSAREVVIAGQGAFEMYPNRDSLRYRKIYGLKKIPNILRGTLRHPGFCEAWDSLIRLGLTENNFPIEDSHKMSFHDLLDAFVDEGAGSLRSRVASFLKVDAQSPVMEKLTWLGLFTSRKLKLKNATPAEILENLLLDKWKMKDNDKDMVMMQHEFEYLQDGAHHLSTSTMTYQGKSADETAMSTLVGLPLGIAAELVLQNKITTPGISIPVTREIYEPVLKALKSFQVDFSETDIVMS